MSKVESLASDAVKRNNCWSLVAAERTENKYVRPAQAFCPLYTKVKSHLHSPRQERLLPGATRQDWKHEWQLWSCPP